jgi:aspartate racemase
MGPLATADFYRKVVEETAAARDQEHVPALICSMPDIPCRTAALLDGGASPLPRMLEGLHKLKQSQVECVAIPCNTAHYWYGDMCRASGMTILHIVDAVRDELETMPQRPRELGLLATESTLAARIYQDRLADAGFVFHVNAPDVRRDRVVAAIALVKAGRPRDAGTLLEGAIADLLEQGVQVPILACTELPVALEAIGSPLLARCVDANRALARAAVAWSVRRRAVRGALAQASLQPLAG